MDDNDKFMVNHRQIRGTINLNLTMMESRSDCGSLGMVRKRTYIEAPFPIGEVLLYKFHVDLLINFPFHHI